MERRKEIKLEQEQEQPPAPEDVIVPEEPPQENILPKEAETYNKMELEGFGHLYHPEARPKKFTTGPVQFVEDTHVNSYLANNK